MEDLFSRDPHRYRLVNAGAHRKPPPLVGTPALTLHYGLWRPRSDNANGNDETNWHREIDNFLYKVFRTLATANNSFFDTVVTPNYDYNGERLYLFRHSVKLSKEGLTVSETQELQHLGHDRNTRYDVFSVRTTFKDIPLTIRAELYGEFWSLDFVVDFDRISPGQANDTSSCVGLFCKDFVDLHSFVVNRYNLDNNNQTSKLPEDDGKHVNENKVSPERISAIRSSLHKRFREQIVDVITNKSPREQKTELGTIFGEFHGMILGFCPEPDAIRSIPVGNNNSESGHTLPELIGKHSFPPDVAPKVVGALWPVIQEFQRTSSSDKFNERKYGKPEFTVSRFQDGRSLYISSLGWLDPNPDGTDAKPIIYTVVVTYRSRWSLGRLIERIHSLGNYRLAAMYDIELVTEAGDKLKQLQDRLRKQEADRATNDDPNRVGYFDVEYFDKERLSAGSAIKYGLMHRVERSQYYVRSFERHLESLRCVRVEGFQPYDQFVRRRMYGAFDYIRRVGDRYVELRAEVTLLLRSENNREVKDLVKKISATANQIEEFNRVSNSLETTIQDLLREMKSNTKKTSVLLSRAEKIILIPLVYYMGHVLATAIAAFQGKQEVSSKVEFTAYLLVAFLICCILIGQHSQDAEQG